MPPQTTLHIRQTAAGKGKHAIRLTLRRAGHRAWRVMRPSSSRSPTRERADLPLVYGGLLAAGGISRAPPVVVEQIRGVDAGAGEGAVQRSWPPTWTRRPYGSRCASSWPSSHVEISLQMELSKDRATE